MVDFNSLRKNRGAALQALQTELEETTTAGKKKKSYEDDRFWQPVVNNIGNGGAIIRFLPTITGEVPFVKFWSHGFQGPSGQWYIANSRTSIGEADPVAEFNSELWNSGQKDQARKQKRRLHFVSNILVVKDPVNPENDGKVFLYKYGKKIFGKIEESLFPPFDEEGRPRPEPGSKEDNGYNPTNKMDPFDMWEGANFKLLIRKVDGHRNYDLSKFATSSAVSESEERMREIFEATHDVAEFIAPENYKPYDELKARLNKILGIDSTAPKLESNVVDDDDDFDLAMKDALGKDTTIDDTDILEDDDTDVDKLIDELKSS